MKPFLFLILFSSILHTSCGQQPTPGKKKSAIVKAPIVDSNQEKITAQNYIEREVERSKNVLQGFEYYFSISPTDCFFEILVNDIPVYRSVEDASVADPVCLNPYINHSGKQTLTYRLYPKNTGNDEGSLKTLTANTRFKIKLVARRESDRINAYKNQKQVLNHTSLTSGDGHTFIAAGKDFYEYTLPFEAEVPYTLPGLEKSQDLRSFDQKALLARTEKAYQYYWKLINDKKMDDYFRLGFKSDLSEILSCYVAKEQIEYVVDADKFHFLVPEFKMKPMGAYQMKLYGNGKVVCLEQTSADPKFTNRSPIWGEADLQTGEISTKFYKLYLHVPAGKSDFEIIYKNLRFSDVF